MIHSEKKIQIYPTWTTIDITTKYQNMPCKNVNTLQIKYSYYFFCFILSDAIFI